MGIIRRTRLVGSIGMPNSGTHMLINILSGAFENHNNHSYIFLGHAKAGIVNPKPINKFGKDLDVVFYYYRNQIDRVMGTIARRKMGDRKGHDTIAGKDTSDYEEAISNEIQTILKSKQSLMEMHVRYAFAVKNREMVTKLCKEKNIKCFPVAYEHVWENYDFIYDRLGKCGIKIAENVRKHISDNNCAEKIYKLCQGPPQNRRRMFPNHVSHYRGEPFFWAKMFDFEKFYHTLPEENKKLITELVKNHLHENLPTGLFNA